MVQFDLENYVSVNERIQAFWKGENDPDETDRRIVTEMLHLDDATVKNRMVVILASIYVNNEKVATGIAKEREGLGGANRLAFIENCETSAIGRALANWGVLVTRNRASQDEMRGAQEVQNEHQNVLANIKKIGMEGNDATKQLIKENWQDCQENPVYASEFLAELQESTSAG